MTIPPDLIERMARAIDWIRPYSPSGAAADVLGAIKPSDLPALVSAIMPGWKLVPVDVKEKCNHEYKTGIGSVSSDGSSYFRWYCTKCAAHGEYTTKSKATPAMLAASPSPTDGG